MLPETSPTLLSRLRLNPNDQDGWAEFVDRYQRHIYAWCCRWNLQASDAQDVTQDVLMKLTKNLQRFEYDPTRSFRAWLRTITRHAWYEFCQSQNGIGKGSGDSQMLNLLHSIEARDNLLQRLEDAFDREILEEAIARVRLCVHRETWQAFYLTAICGQSGTEVAAKTGLKIGQVYVAKNRVLKMMAKHVQLLNGDDTLGEPQG